MFGERLISQAIIALGALLFTYYTAWILGLPLVKEFFPFPVVFPDSHFAVAIPLATVITLCTLMSLYICVIVTWKPL